MNIVIEKCADLSSLVKVTVAEADYAEVVDKVLRDYKRKANVPGFRPGMVPMGVINKMYRKGAVAEESYKLASRSCFEHLEKEGIDFIGDVIPSEKQEQLDFDNNTQHEFVFEFAESPKVELSLSSSDVVTKCEIEVSEAMQNDYRSNYLRKFGKLVDVETVECDEALTVVLDNEEIKVEDAYVGLISMSEEERAPFIGKKIGDVMEVDVNELYKTPAQRAAILQMKEDELDSVNPKFTLTITNIRKFADPELNDEFFAMAFPKGDVKDEAGLNEYVCSQIAKELARESEGLFAFKVREMLISKAGLVMPAEFLKRWLFTINQGKFTMEDIEKDFDAFLSMMSWNLIQKSIIKANNLEVTKEEAVAEACDIIKMQFAQYGMGDMETEQLTMYAEQMLSNKEEANKVFEKIYEAKVVAAVAPQITVETKSVSVEEFGKIVDELRK